MLFTYFNHLRTWIMLTTNIMPVTVFVRDAPVIFTKRKTMSDVRLGNLMMLKNTVITFLFPIIHRNKKYRGEDADKLNPMQTGFRELPSVPTPSLPSPYSSGNRT